MNAAVIGAGIGGLTIASLLIEEGYNVTVFEKMTKKETSDDVGAGIIVGGNVMDKFSHHPLRKDIQKISHVIHTMEVLNDKEKILSRLSLSTQRLNLAMKRSDLRETIHHYVPADCVQYNTLVTYVENRDKEVILYKYLMESINNEAILLHNIYDIKPLDCFHDNRVVLLGDAAHAMTPNTGQGAGQAMEDAIALYHCLKQNSDIHAALYRYDQLRAAHTKKILELSRLAGKAATLENTLLIFLRDRILSLLPDRLMNKQTDFLYNNKIK